jgi:DNA polymerase-3 subunit beta
MKVAIKQERLAHALVLVGRVASSRAALPVLANVLLKADKNKLTLTTTNLEIAISQTLSGKIEKPGAITIPARLLNDYISSLPGESVELEADSNKLKIKSDKYQSTINGMAAEEFPELPSINKGSEFSIDGQELKTAIQQTIFAASGDETRPILTGGFIHTHNNQIWLVSTDSYRLAQKQLPTKPDKEFQLIAPASALGDMVRIIGDESGTIKVAYDESQIQFKFGDSILITRQIDGQFPDYRQLIPKDSEVKITVNKTEFTNITKVASLFARESAGSVTLEVDEKQQQVSITSVASQVGENTSVTSAKAEGSGKVTLNSRYLLDVLNVIEGEDIEFRFSGKVSPCVLTSVSHQDYTHIIMPLKS